MHVRTALTAALALIGLTGCAMTGAEAEVATLDEVKAETWAVQDSIAAQLPAEVVLGEPARGEEMTLIDRCDGENRWRWPGAWEVAIDPATDTTAFLASLEAEWASTPGWTTEYVSSEPTLTIMRDDGAWFKVFPVRDNAGLHIASSSACFQLDVEYNPATKY